MINDSLNLQVTFNPRYYTIGSPSDFTTPLANNSKRNGNYSTPRRIQYQQSPVSMTPIKRQYLETSPFLNVPRQMNVNRPHPNPILHVTHHAYNTSNFSTQTYATPRNQPQYAPMSSAQLPQNYFNVNVQN